MHPKVELYLSQEKKWQEEIAKLRMIVLDCGLTEEFKWGVPCYTYAGNNVVLIHVFKEYCALLFFKGALLNDEHGALVKQTKNTQATRQIRFVRVEEIIGMEPIVKSYIHQAIEVEKAGLKVNFKTTADYDVPEEFQNQLKEVPGLQTAFDKLTPGRQKAYLLYFSAPKQSRTREARIIKYIPHILDGKGLNDD